MHSTELVPNNQDLERHLRPGALMADLTLIYNSHRSPEHARQSTAYVEPDSLVFLEGFTLVEGSEPPYASNLRLLNSIRFTAGKDNLEFVALKALLIDDISTRLNNYEPASRSDFSLHTFAKLGQLLEKDCVVAYADYSTIDLGTVDETRAEKYKKHNEQFRDDVDGINMLPTLEIGATEGLGRAIIKMNKSVFSWMAANTSREKVAVAKVLIGVNEVAQHADTSTVRKNTGGQFTTYMIYGTAHALSLTSQFTLRGMTPDVIEVHELPDCHYLDNLLEPSYNNFRRRLGHAMLRSLTMDLVADQHHDDIVEKTYEELEPLNSITHDEFHAFIFTCASIARQINRNPDIAFDQYKSLLRSLANIG